MSNIKKYRKGENIRLSRNFHLREFECTCKYPDCQWTLVDLDHVEKLQKKRTKWRKSVSISSAYRCEKHNKDVGGATRSQHLKGTATDIKVKGLSPDKVADDCEKKDKFNGVGRYSTFTHLDSRDVSVLARWDFRKK